MAEGSGLFKELDQILVCSQAWAATAVQEPQDEGISNFLAGLEPHDEDAAV